MKEQQNVQRARFTPYPNHRPRQFQERPPDRVPQRPASNLIDTRRPGTSVETFDHFPANISRMEGLTPQEISEIFDGPMC